MSTADYTTWNGLAKYLAQVCDVRSRRGQRHKCGIVSRGTARRGQTRRGQGPSDGSQADAEGTMEIFLEVASLLVIGWIAGAELGSWCCVQPTVERLPYEQQVTIEKAMLRTFGRIMPVLMPLSGILAVALVLFSRSEGSVVLWLRGIATICIAITIITTLRVNVPINNLTSRWPLTNDVGEWLKMRRRWHLFQGVRGGLFMAAFVLLVVATVIPQRS